MMKPTWILRHKGTGKPLFEFYGSPTPANAFEAAVAAGTCLAGLSWRGGEVERLNKRVALGGINLNEAALDGAVFLGCDMAAARLTSVHARGAIFADCDLSGAQFDKSALGGAGFFNCDLSGTSFTGADIRGISLEGSKLGVGIVALLAEYLPSPGWLSPQRADVPLAGLLSGDHRGEHLS